MAGGDVKALAGGCTLGSSVIATWHIYKHLCNYTEPMYQRYTVRIIFMIHVYGLMSYLALVRPREAIYFSSLCGIYEAWVIYNFTSLCIAFIGGPGAVATSLHGRYLKPSWHLMTCCCDAIPLDGVFIRRCKRGVLQFVILKPLLVAATLMLYESDLYEDGSFSTTNGYLYITIVYTFSYTLALAALLLFYVACKSMLQPFQPLPKFLIIKSVVFLTYWQSVIIALLASGDIIKTAQDALDVQNITICIEMLFAAVGHLYAFPYKVYADSNINGGGSLTYSILHALSFSDLVYDTMHQFAPTYQEYVLYSNGSEEAPQRHRVPMLIPMGLGQEMDQVVRNNSMTQILSFGEPEGAKTNIVGVLDTERQSIPAGDRSPPTYSQMLADVADDYRASGSTTKPSSGSNSFSDNDFNPRGGIIPRLDSRGAALPDHNIPAAGSGKNLFRHSSTWDSQAMDSRRESAVEEEITELTKLTERRASEHGPLVDTIDVRGENEEFSEGFIQR